jgi:hypothetical protein
LGPRCDEDEFRRGAEIREAGAAQGLGAVTAQLLGPRGIDPSNFVPQAS